MTFKMIAKDKLKIVLSAVDMGQLAISYSQLDYEDDLTKQVLLKLLTAARVETGFDARNARLFIEVYPYDEGGCVIYCTTLPPEEDESAEGATEPGPVIFRFDDVDVLIQACTKLFCQYGHQIYKSELYRMEGSYRLIVYTKAQDKNRTVGLLSEYGRMTGEGAVAAALVEEHAEPLLSERAIDTLSYYLADP
jgi:negative regulator of genetic competence, sporulation and motility